MYFFNPEIEIKLNKKFFNGTVVFDLPDVRDESKSFKLWHKVRTLLIF